MSPQNGKSLAARALLGAALFAAATVGFAQSAGEVEFARGVGFAQTADSVSIIDVSSLPPRVVRTLRRKR